MTDDLAEDVAPSNLEQLREWDGDEGDFWVAHADHFDRALAGYHQALLDAAAITRADRVLDLGCGIGRTTRDAARAATEGTALGVDLSARMLEEARVRADAEGLTNALFLQADAQVYPFDPATHDVAISRTGTMFFGDLPAAFVNIARALRPGGRLAMLTWQPFTESYWLQTLSRVLTAGRDLPGPRPDAPGPFSLSDPGRVRSILGDAGFTDVSLESLTAGMWFGRDVDDAYRFVLGKHGWMLDGLDAGARARAEEELRATMAAHETGDGVVLDSAAWLVRAARP